MALKIVVGRMYHVEGWKPGAFFRLLDVKDGEAKLETPKRHRKYKVGVSQLRNINKYGAKKLNREASNGR